MRTIDEAIEYYIKEATQRAIADEEMGVNDNSRWNETRFMTKKQSDQIIADNRQLAKWLTNYKEAVRLLKLAVDDIHELLCDREDVSGGKGQTCNICSYIEWCNCCQTCTVIDELKNWRYADEAIALLNATTAEDVQPVKRGKWEYRGSGSPEFTFRCSCCKNIASNEYSYCPNCGARMMKDGDAE